MAVLLATLLLDVADTPPFTVDEAGIEDETVIKPTVSDSFSFELSTRRLVRTFSKRLIRERDDEGYMTNGTHGASRKSDQWFWQPLRDALGASPQPQFRI